MLVVAGLFVLLVVGLAADVTALVLVGFFGVVMGLIVLAAAAGGEWIREASARRFRDRNH